MTIKSHGKGNKKFTKLARKEHVEIFYETVPKFIEASKINFVYCQSL